MGRYDAYLFNVFALDFRLLALKMNDNTLMIPTASRYGWTSTIPNPMTCRFIDLINSLNKPTVIDIGAGYGVASIPAMEAGAYVIVNDVDQSQLDSIAKLAREKGLDKMCRLMNATLPNMPEVPPLDALHASNVLHFLTGAQIEQAADWMHRALKEGRKSFSSGTFALLRALTVLFVRI